MDALTLIGNIQRFSVIAFAFTYVTGHINIWQEVHLNFNDPISLTGFATPPFDIKTETTRFVAARSCFMGSGKQFPDGRKEARIGGRI